MATAVTTMVDDNNWYDKVPTNYKEGEFEYPENSSATRRSTTTTQQVGESRQQQQRSTESSDGQEDTTRQQQGTQNFASLLNTNNTMFFGDKTASCDIPPMTKINTDIIADDLDRIDLLEHIDVIQLSPGGKILEIAFKNRRAKEYLVINGLNTHGVNLTFRHDTPPLIHVSVLSVPAQMQLHVVKEEMQRYGKIEECFDVLKRFGKRKIQIANGTRVFKYSKLYKAIPRSLLFGGRPCPVIYTGQQEHLRNQQIAHHQQISQSQEQSQQHQHKRVQFVKVAEQQHIDKGDTQSRTSQQMAHHEQISQSGEQSQQHQHTSVQSVEAAEQQQNDKGDAPLSTDTTKEQRVDEDKAQEEGEQNTEETPAATKEDANEPREEENENETPMETQASNNTRKREKPKSDTEVVLPKKSLPATKPKPKVNPYRSVVISTLKQHNDVLDKKSLRQLITNACKNGGDEQVRDFIYNITGLIDEEIDQISAWYYRGSHKEYTTKKEKEVSKKGLSESVRKLWHNYEANAEKILDKVDSAITVSKIHIKHTYKYTVS